MKIDMLRALGVSAAIFVTGLALYAVFLTVGMLIETVDILVLAFSVVALAWFSTLYFKDRQIELSWQTGLYLGLVVLVSTFVIGFFEGYLAGLTAAMTEQSDIYMFHTPSAWIMWVSAAMGPLVPTLVGWHLSKKEA